MKRTILLLFLLLLSSLQMMAQIRVSLSANDIEQYAAQELQRYYYCLYGDVLPVCNAGESNFVLKQDASLAEQSYVISTESSHGKNTITIAGGDASGILYGVYGLLEDHVGVRFYMSGDVLPEHPQRLGVIHDSKTPAQKIRGFLPWTNFPQSATIYSFDDWQYIIDQCAKMRMNFIMIHNYNGFCNHNEMFHNFEYKGHLSRSWFATIKTGHGWECPGWNINDYLFGASAIYGDYDFGADCALHNETLSNREIYDKGITTFRHVIEYAHSRGVKIGLGLDIDVIPSEYGVDASCEEVVSAQTSQIIANYPRLDYLLCFQSESTKDKAFYDRWNKIFHQFYTDIKTALPHTKIAVSGWGVTRESAAALPEDVICAPISHYSAKCESGEIYGNRQTWGCPWLERDFNSSEYYYPYNMDLSETIDSYRGRAANMEGFYTLTWRLTDAVSAKMWYVSKAPWWDDTRLDSSRKVYFDFAKYNYGQAAAEKIIDIIDQKELFATDFGECQKTPGFNTVVDEYALLNVSNISLRQDSIELKQVAATQFSDKKGTQNAAMSDGGECVGFIMDGHWLKYPLIDFGEGAVTRMGFRVASASNGGAISVRLDNPLGREIAVARVKNTGGWQSWREVSAAVAATHGRHDIYLVFSATATPLSNLKDVQAQLAVIDQCIASTKNPAQKQRLGYLRARTEGVAQHITLNLEFNKYEWSDLPGAMEPWAESFLHRIDDISSLGNIMSTQNRFVQQNYLKKIEDLSRRHRVKAPTHVESKGTQKGAIVTWRNDEPAVRRFEVYRDTVCIGSVPSSVKSFADTHDGYARYSVSAVDVDGRASVKSISDYCYAGMSDREPPVIICTSPLTSVAAGAAVDVEISLVDKRVSNLLSAVVKYRMIGDKQWREQRMNHKARAVFGCRLPVPSAKRNGMEYYIEVSDGANRSTYPVGTPQQTHTVVVSDSPQSQLFAPKLRIADLCRLQWSEVASANRYRIYRSRVSQFEPDPTTFVTFLPATCSDFKDNQLDFEGKTCEGRYYYGVTAVDAAGRESRISNCVSVIY